jgi:hypothetical protein
MFHYIRVLAYCFQFALVDSPLMMMNRTISETQIKSKQRRASHV